MSTHAGALPPNPALAGLILQTSPAAAKGSGPAPGKPPSPSGLPSRLGRVEATGAFGGPGGIGFEPLWMGTAWSSLEKPWRPGRGGGGSGPVLTAGGQALGRTDVWASPLPQEL